MRPAVRISGSDMTLAEQHAHIVALEKRRRLYSVATVAMLAAVLAAGSRQADQMNAGGFVSGLSKFFNYPSEIVVEAWQGGLGPFVALLGQFLPALIETLNIAAVATILGGLAAIGMGFLASRDLSRWPWAVPIVRRTMDAMRAFPELIVALFLIYVLGSSPVPAMLAIAFHTAGALGKQFSEVNENIDRKPVDGLRAVGAGWLQCMKFAALPQVLPNYLSYFLLRLEINVRASAILGFVGAGGIGAELRRTIGWGQGAGDETAALFVLLLGSIIAIDQFSSWLRRRLVEGSAL